MPGKPVIRLEIRKFRSTDLVVFLFESNDRLSEIIMRLDGARWSYSLDCWYIPADMFCLGDAFNKLRPHAFLDYSSLKSGRSYDESNPNIGNDIQVRQATIPSEYPDKLEQLRYSDSTIQSYITYFREFLAYFFTEDPENITTEEINQYLVRLIREKGISPSAQNQRINAIKFYYEKVLGREKQYFKISRPRKEKKLPDVLSKQEIAAMISKTTNLKHKSLLMMIYSCGLRRSEVIHLELKDIDSDRMLVKIRGAKGRKDRYVQLASATLIILREYFREYRPSRWLYEGQRGGQYSNESIFRVVKDAGRRAGITKNVFPHILRHSYATHHLEQGTDLRYIQEWLGHSSSKTTEIYTHVSRTDYTRFRNPIDDIFPGE